MISPKVSVIVPVYNVEKYIRRCLDSIISQTFFDFECILIDDCTPDNSGKICDEYSEKDSRFIVIHKLQNEGLPQARKTGFEHSRGEYIQFIDSDDWIEQNMIEKLYTSALEADADITVCDYYNNNEYGYSYYLQTIDTENNFNNFGFINCCTVWNNIFKRNIIEKITFPKSGKYEDRVLTQQAYFYAKKIIKIPYPLYHYFCNHESMYKELNVKTCSQWIENILYVIKFLRINLNDKFSIKEKNINNYVNNFKLKIKKNKLLRLDKSLEKFYPQSKFKRWLFLYYLKNTIKMIIPYGLYYYYKKHNIS